MSKPSGPGAAKTDDQDGRLEEILRALVDSPGDQAAWDELRELMWPRAYDQAIDAFGGDVARAGRVSKKALGRLARKALVHLLREPTRFQAHFDDLVQAAIANERQAEASRRREARDEGSRLTNPNSWEELLALEERLQTLSPKERELLKLRHLDGATFTELAALYHVSRSTARTRVKAAEWQLRRNFGLIPGDPLE